jgi:hypothetical protein
MKTTLLAIALLIGASCTAQIGLITLNKKAKNIPIGQWYTYTMKNWGNSVVYLNKTEEVHEKLNEILRENEVFFEEYKIDEDGDKYWVIKQANGFLSHVFLIPDDEGWMKILVLTEL